MGKYLKVAKVFSNFGYIDLSIAFESLHFIDELSYGRGA